MTAIIVTLLLLIAAMLAGAGAMAVRFEWDMRKLTCQRYIVTVHGDLPFVGVLTQRGRATYIFDQCHTVPGLGETAQPIAGRVVIDRPSIAYMQQVSLSVDLPGMSAPVKAAADVSE